MESVPLDRISLDSLGVPYIRDTGVAVWQVSGQLLQMGSIDKLLSQYPQLSREDIEQATIYSFRETRKAVSNLSYELRTPIAIIQTRAYLISRSDDRQKQIGWSARISEQIEQINHWLDRLFAYAHLFSDGEPRPMPLEDIFRQIRQHDKLKDVVIEIAAEAGNLLVNAPPSIEYDLMGIMLSKSDTFEDLFQSRTIIVQVQMDNVEIALYCTYNPLPNSLTRIENILVQPGNPITRATFHTRQCDGTFDLRQSENQAIFEIHLPVGKKNL